jgi:hypothetical protein
MARNLTGRQEGRGDSRMGTERALAVRWIGGHVGGMLLVSAAWLALLQRRALPADGYFAVVIAEGLSFGLAQGLALWRVPFPIPRWRWAAATFLAAGAFFALGIEGLKSSMKVGSVGGGAFPGVGVGTAIFAWAVSVLTPALGLATVQGALLGSRVRRAVALGWAALTVLAFVATEIALQLPHWVLPRETLTAWPFGGPLAVFLARPAVRALLFSLLTLPAIRSLVRPPAEVSLQ